MGVDAEMVVKTTAKVTPEQVTKWAWAAYGAFGHDDNLLWIRDDRKHCLEIVKSHSQDGPTVKPKRGETFIEVSLICRFYGKGYERGPIVQLCALASWLEFNIPGGEVMYGGDSSGVLLEPFGPKERDNLLEHFYKVGHLPYQGGFDMLRGTKGTVVCGRCQQPMICCGGGGGIGPGGYDFMYCYGCNHKAVVSRNSGKILASTDKRDADFCDMSWQLVEEYGDCKKVIKAMGKEDFATYANLAAAAGLPEDRLSKTLELLENRREVKRVYKGDAAKEIVVRMPFQGKDGYA